MRSLPNALFIARKDVAYMLRAKETILWVFIMPLLFFYFIGTVTGGMGGPPRDEDAPDPLALRAPEDAGFLVGEIERRLRQQNFEVHRFAPSTVGAVDDDEGVGDGNGNDAPGFEDYGRRLTVPDPPDGRTFTEAVLAGQQQALRWGRSGDDLNATFDQVRVARAVYAVVGDLVVLAEEDGEPTPDAFARLAAMPRTLALDVRPAGERREIPSGYEQTIPGTLVMFTMLVLLTSGSIVLVIEREQGLLRRLAATPISRAAVVGGKWGGKLALGLVQIAVAMAYGTWLFGLDWGRSLPMASVVLLAWAAFNAALAILLANLARSEAQMAGLGVFVTMLLAALGGCWWPIEITPAWMQQLSLALPTGWTMDVMHRLISFGDGPGAAVPHLVALLLSSLIAGWLAVRTFRYQ